MTHPLDGVYVKLARADAHFDVVYKAAYEGIDREPEMILGEFDAEAERYLFRTKRTSRDPDALSPVIGDCVHNLKAALDYLVWELVIIGGNTGTTRTEFPIFTDPAVYAREAPKKIRGVPPDAEAVFERLQPFGRPNRDLFEPGWLGPEQQPLAILYALDKWDKHRSLNLTRDVASLRLIGTRRTEPLPYSPIKFTSRFKRDAVIAELNPLGQGHPHVKVYLSAAFHVAFEESGPAGGEPVVQTLDNIRKVVRRRVIPAFARFFPRRPGPRPPSPRDRRAG